MFSMTTPLPPTMMPVPISNLPSRMTALRSTQRKVMLGVVTVKAENSRVLPSGEAVKVIDKYRNPVPIKTLMTGLGMPAGQCKQPLGRMSRAGVEVVRAAAKQVWDRSPEILEPISRFYGIDVGARLADDAIWEALAA